MPEYVSLTRIFRYKDRIEDYIFIREKKVSEKTRILACFTRQTFWCGKPRKNKNTESVLNLTFSHKSVFVISENTIYRDSPQRLICEKNHPEKSHKSHRNYSLQPVTLLEKGLPISCFLWILKKIQSSYFTDYLLLHTKSTF